jgi:DNA invertase Pin-like site-specific DNA recombinase
MKQKKYKAVIYCRAASIEQNNNNELDRQEKLLKGYAKKHNFEPVKIYKLIKSGKDKKPINELFNFANKNNIHIILSESINTLTRCMGGPSEMYDWMEKDKKNEFHFVDCSFVFTYGKRN